MLLSAFNKLKAKEYLTFQKSYEQDNMTHFPPTLGVVEFQLADVFLVIFILNMDRKPNVVEFFILGPSMARLAL